MKTNIKEIAVFGMLGALMCISKFITEPFPNIHLLGVFTVAFTVVYRQKALYPIYTFVFLAGAIWGIGLWWIPYLYTWTVLWGAVMLLPKNMPKKIAPIVYAVVCSLHGYLYGVLYAPSQALLFGLDFKGTIAWIISGFPFDLVHGTSNLCLGVLIIPIATVLKKTNKLVR